MVEISSAKRLQMTRIQIQHHQRRDLRNGTSLWLDGSTPLIRCSRTPGKQRFDTGSSVPAFRAQRLLSAARKERTPHRRPPASPPRKHRREHRGLQFEIDTPLFELSRRIGRDMAERAWQRSMKAVRDLRSVVTREAIDCGWRNAKTLYLAGDAYGYRALRTEVDARERAGIPGDYLSGAEFARCSPRSHRAIFSALGAGESDAAAPVLFSGG